ncbi:hypothetical protein GJ496_009916 [Pomphorhynchus laevis]|nr:hypothetical protein GJ496_009916 [Pomphorhynchus laevis]
MDIYLLCKNLKIWKFLMNIFGLLKLFYLCVFALIGCRTLSHTSGFGKQDIVIHPEDSQIQENHNATVSCKVINREGKVVWCVNYFCTFPRPVTIWEKDCIRHLKYDNHYSTLIDECEGKFNLIITNFSSKLHSGIYQCQVLKTSRQDAVLSRTANITSLPANIDNLEKRLNNRSFLTSLRTTYKLPDINNVSSFVCSRDAAQSLRYILLMIITVAVLIVTIIGICIRWTYIKRRHHRIFDLTSDERLICKDEPDIDKSDKEIRIR